MSLLDDEEVDPVQDFKNHSLLTCLRDCKGAPPRDKWKNRNLSKNMKFFMLEVLDFRCATDELNTAINL